MRKALIPAFLLLLGATILGATVLREPLARAATPFTNVIVSNAKTNPVPVQETNTDADGNIKVHEQGTASVNVTNDTLSVKEPVVPSGPGEPALLSGHGSPVAVSFGKVQALVITMTSGVDDIEFYDFGSEDIPVAAFAGPHSGGPSTITVSFPQPINVLKVLCDAVSTEKCTVGAVGAG